MEAKGGDRSALSPDRIDRARGQLAACVTASKTPGLQYVAVDASGVLLEYHGGWANIEQRLAMAAGTTHMAYSMCKPITAVAVLQLVDACKVRLDDAVSDHVEHVPYGPTVTIQHLLSHTSGIPNPIPLRWVHPPSEHSAFDELAALRARLLSHPRLASAPGTRYLYSNIGYWLLGVVVERASGVPFRNYVTDNIFVPLGIGRHELGYDAPDPSHHARGYLSAYSFMNLVKRFVIDRAFIGRYTGRWLEIRPHHVDGAAFGGLVGTARGFGVFLRDQLQPHSAILSDAARRLLHEPMPPPASTMTLGWHVHSSAPRYLFKEGAGGGFHCMMRLYPTRGLASVIMANSTGFDVERVLDAVDATLVGAAAP